jgi:putative membrane protein
MQLFQAVTNAGGLSMGEPAEVRGATPGPPGGLPPDDPRILWAAERTLLAWVRTSIAIMGFGFIVARFGLFLREIEATREPARAHHALGWSLWIGLALIALATVISLLAPLEYRETLARPRGTRRPPLAVVVSLAMAAIGVVMAVYLIRVGR